MSKRKKKNTVLRIISGFLWLLALISMGYLCYLIYTANILPTKYYMILVGVMVFLILMFILFIRNKNSRAWILIICDIIFIPLIGISYFANDKLDDTLKFLKDNLNAKYETNIYNVVVNKNSNINSISDLNNKTIKLVNDMDDKTLLEKSINKKIKNSKLEYSENVAELLYEVKDNIETIIIVNSGNYDAMVEENQEYTNSVKVLDTIEIKQRIENTSTGVDVTEDSFIVYLSGIDTRSGKLPAKSLSDVNILLVVNPTEKKILMVNTPRDYYVQLHGKTGLKDKLTHAGLVGGVNMSMSTLEDLYEIKVPYYVRVNFNAVVKLVDAIDGITLYNDQTKSFTCWTDRDCVFKPGDNKVKGKCALAFARERHAYAQGDRHRGENQEQVIQKIIEKVTSSKTLISKYSDILTSLNGTFETNITTEEITSLVKMQVDDMSGWTIDTYNVSGSDLYAYTYSYPSRELYVMNPNLKTVEEAKVKLNQALNKN